MSCVSVLVGWCETQRDINPNPWEHDFSKTGISWIWSKKSSSLNEDFRDLATEHKRRLNIGMNGKNGISYWIKKNCFRILFFFQRWGYLANKNGYTNRHCTIGTTRLIHFSISPNPFGMKSCIMNLNQSIWRWNHVLVVQSQWGDVFYQPLRMWILYTASAWELGLWHWLWFSNFTPGVLQNFRQNEMAWPCGLRGVDRDPELVEQQAYGWAWFAELTPTSIYQKGFKGSGPQSGRNRQIPSGWPWHRGLESTDLDLE